MAKERRGVFETGYPPAPWTSSPRVGERAAPPPSGTGMTMPPPPPFRTPARRDAGASPPRAVSASAAGDDFDTDRDLRGSTAGAAATAPAPVPRRPGRSRRRRRGRALWVLLAVFLLVGGVAGAASFWFLRQVNPPGAPGPDVTVTVPAGIDRDGLVQLLSDSGVVTSAWAFSTYLRVQQLPTVSEGDYVFAAPSAYSDILNRLRQPPEKKQYKVTFPEGFTVRQVAERIQKEVPGVTVEQFNRAMAAGTARSRYMAPDVTSYEGFLFPDTYMFSEGETAEEILTRMTARFDEVADEVGIATAPGVTPYEVVRVASMIEREARIDADRAKISRVIYNRLNAGMPLQIDATLMFAAPPGTEPAELDYKQDGPYNSYTRKGLPPTPISNPGRASLQAAAHPEDGPWLYYVLTDESGAHKFSTTLAEHERARADAKARGIF